MKITLLGSLGNINQHYIPRLIAEGHEVTVISSKADRAAEIEKMGAHAAIGSNRDLEFLINTFKGSDVVYLMVSGGTPTQDMAKDAQILGEIYSQAVKISGVKKVVNLSSVGADVKEAGILYSYHFIEEALNALEGVNVRHIRPVGFYTNLFSELATIKASQTIFEPVAIDTVRAWVYPTDIADVVYESLTQAFTDKSVQYVVSDWVTGDDWIQALRTVGLEVTYQQVAIETVEDTMRKSGFSESNVAGFAQLNRVQQNPEQFYKAIKNSDYHLGEVKVADFAKIFIKKYQNQ
ncbi:NAD(P)H-binding protein [Lactococcus protaetiae]|uniref:Nucleoside-diphosphate sugar epimerase n=1 Tax=Lactococcus protaetiae TaxID=2592653 RepID=A0A514Z628_9LACT|nr:NAD(P)H-binding protein [Lactococcus protaetiae]QDK70013.1 nucleoside-diphosphate sugar epimerase [Lactococcus protaetiae]